MRTSTFYTFELIFKYQNQSFAYVAIIMFKLDLHKFLNKSLSSWTQKSEKAKVLLVLNY